MPDRRRAVTLILRCLPGPAADWQLVGRGEVVDTGEVVVIRTVDEFVDVIRRLAIAPAGSIQ